MSDTQTDAPATAPILFLRHAGAGGMRLAALVVRPEGAPPGELRTEGDTHAPEKLVTRAGATVWRYAFDLPPRNDAWYEFDGARHAVDADTTGDLRIAYVSCNGQEHGDLDRPERARNAMWRHLGKQNARRPLHLILHGGDQIYADEVTDAHPLSRGWPEDLPDTLTPEQEHDLRETLARAFFDRYARQLAQRSYNAVTARVPSLAMWDDHDICDGWGSLPAAALDSPVGRILFDTAREAFLLFQQGHAPDEIPEICPDRSGRSLTWSVALPGLSVIAPDLRSSRRPDRVMDAEGWDVLRRALDEAGPGKVLLMSSVPALGPRLSLVEQLMQLTKRMEKYEDDLRDQWQSRAHRDEWRDFLRALIEVHGRDDTSLTVLSGEIHLATRGTMRTDDGPLHQLVASGISHPAPPKAYARGLGTLARLGEAPLKEHPIRLHPLPGLRRIYAAERNYLMLEREDGDWTAVWQLEESGATAPLAL
ncbi:alkaline phosphatase D family protein [Tranquillimonas alkanivorans]|uniref:PhoD-like phosphatase n=1 Tax=Tranquillimonas alkanivorans TaxID=441119 RepID=A0A1I5QA58_9RHOB|nr:alkaline phosphatase D family protein [Tranquillimonas alkanivorans]SFP43113.1 PhoD-like phosphatase [Tranquillimonas alkanivorans]